MADPLFRIVSLEEWPADLPRTEKPVQARFRANYSDTLKLLARELEMLDAEDVKLEADADWSHIRRDGQMRADARLKSQGVILSFDSRHGPLRYPCDAFDDWQDNLRAITLALEALRKVDRYGVSKRGEQYRGWDRLPPAGGITVTMTAKQAAAFLDRHDQTLGGWVQEILTMPDFYREAYRSVARVLHPDAGGTTADFQMLQEAKRVLDRHHGLTTEPTQQEVAR